MNGKPNDKERLNKIIELKSFISEGQTSKNRKAIFGSLSLNKILIAYYFERRNPFGLAGKYFAAQFTNVGSGG